MCGRCVFVHERIRRHAQAAAAEVKVHGRPNDLLERLAGDAAFAEIDVKKVLHPKAYLGRAPQQVTAFIREFVTPIRRRYRAALDRPADLNV